MPHRRPDGADAEVALTQLRPGDVGWARVSHGAVIAPGPSFFVNIASPLVGRFECAVASLPGRVSVLTLILRPDGRLDSAQHILRLPGKHYDEPVEHVPYGVMVRQLTLGQRLYESGELVERAGKGYTPLMELLYAKWTDPLLGCMAYYAWADAIAGTGPSEARSMADQTAQNLLRYFGELPDARVAAALALPDQRDTLIDGLLTENAVPVLARSCRELASEAVARGKDGADVVGWATRIPLTDPWTRRFQPATSGTNEEVTGGPAVAVKAEGTHLFWERMADDRVAGSPTGSGFEIDRSYVVVRLAEMYLGTTRTLWRKFSPLLHAFTAYDADKHEEHTVAGPGQLQELGESNLDRVMVFNTRLAGPRPYRGGDVSILSGLYSVPREDAATALLATVGAMAGIAGPGAAVVPQLANLVKTGVDSILGLGTTKLRLGISDTFAGDRPC